MFMWLAVYDGAI